MEDLTARGRPAITLGVLGVLFVVGVIWAWSQVTEPLPEAIEAPPCTTQPVQVGEIVRPPQVMVSVLNASDRVGLAGETMDELAGRGFAEGELGNAAAATATAPAVIWASPDDPVALLMKSYLRGDVEIVEQASSYPGITIVVGKGFPGVKKGWRKVTAETEGRVCVPNQTEAPSSTVSQDSA